MFLILGQTKRLLALQIANEFVLIHALPLNNFLPATASFATIFYAVFATPIDSDRL